MSRKDVLNNLFTSKLGAPNRTDAQPRRAGHEPVRSGAVSAGAHGETRTVSYGQWDQEMGGFSGSASFTCHDGSWVGGGSCEYSYKPPPCSGGGCGWGE